MSIYHPLWGQQDEPGQLHPVLSLPSDPLWALRKEGCLCFASCLSNLRRLGQQIITKSTNGA